MSTSGTLRKLLSVLLVICLAFTLCSAAVMASGEATGETPVVDEPPADDPPADDPPAEDEPAAPEAFVGTFVTDEGVASIDLYYTNTYEGDPNEFSVSSAYARGSKTGEIDVSGSGQFNFVIRLNEGYSLADVTAAPADNFNKCSAADKLDESTYIYKITKVSGDVTITITTATEAVEVVPFVAAFQADEHVTSIDAYTNNKYAEPVATGVTETYVYNTKTGEYDVSGEGQVNFKINVEEGWFVKSVTVTEGTYNKCNDKGNNCWSITKAASDLTIAIVTTDEQPDPYNFTLKSDGIYNNYGVNIGTSLKITAPGEYSLTGDGVTDYVESRVQVQSEGVKVLLKDVQLTWTNGAPVNCKFDTVLQIEGVVRLTRSIDAEDDPTDDGGKVIKGESGTAGEAVDIEFIGDGKLYIDAPKKGIGTDVYMGDETTYGKSGSDSLAFEQGLDENGNKTPIVLDATVTFNGPYIEIHSGHECVEANIINFLKGSGVFISAKNDYRSGDDGVNVGTDADDADEDDIDGDGNTRERLYPNVSYDMSMLAINFKGGTWYIDSVADGVDSNGNLIISGGTTVVYGTTNASNSALDYGAENRGSFEFTGEGTILAVGNSGMQEAPKGVYIYLRNQNVRSGDVIKIAKEDGTVIYEATDYPYTKNGANCILFGSPDLVEGETYVVTYGSTTVNATAQSGQGGGSGGPSGEGPGGQGPGGQGSGEMGQGSYTKGSERDTDIRFNAGSNGGSNEQLSVVSVKVDGKTVDPGSYTYRFGRNGRVTFKAAFLETLDAGEHKVEIELKLGEETRTAEAKLTVVGGGMPTSEQPTPGPRPTEKPSDNPSGEQTPTPAPGGNNSNKNNNNNGSNEQNKNNTNKNNNASGNAKTGDESVPVLWAVVLVMCVGSVIVLLPRKKHE